MKTSIIATGASLKGFDFGAIEGHKIVINYACDYIDDYDILVAIDNPRKYKMKIDERLWTHQCWAKELGGVGNTFRKKGFKGIDRRPGYVGGCNNSLYAAINLALNWGYNEIDIYGADMRLTDGYSHFYSKERITDPRKISNYDRIFFRCESFKKLFLSQLKYKEKLNWINPQPEKFFNGSCLIED